VEPTRLQKERKAKEQLAEKHINRSWEKELRSIARDRRKWKELVDNLCS
jgi:DNA topoisomerase IA